MAYRDPEQIKKDWKEVQDSATFKVSVKEGWVASDDADTVCSAFIDDPETLLCSIPIHIRYNSDLWREITEAYRLRELLIEDDRHRRANTISTSRENTDGDAKYYSALVESEFADRVERFVGFLKDQLYDIRTIIDNHKTL